MANYYCVPPAIYVTEYFNSLLFSSFTKSGSLLLFQSRKTNAVKANSGARMGIAST